MIWILRPNDVQMTTVKRYHLNILTRNSFRSRSEHPVACGRGRKRGVNYLLSSPN